MAPKEKTKFLDKWFIHKDYSLWISKTKSVYKARCKLCCKDIDLSTMGSSSLDSHAAGEGHKDLVALRKKGLDIFFTKSTSTVDSTASSSSVEVEEVREPTPLQTNLDYYLAVKERVLNAEIYWVLKVIESHMSYRSCEDISELFKVMFGVNEINEKFTCGKTKCGYFISYGLAPYLKDLLLQSIKLSPYFVISFDESMNFVTQDEQMDIGICFWNEEKGLAETRYFDSQFLSRPNASNLVECIMNSCKTLKLENLLQLSMDGPSVNWAVLQQINTKLEKYDNECVNIGSCGQHILHGSFKTGFTDGADWNVHKILKSLYWLFHDSPARRDVFRKEGGSEEFPLMFCGTRWVEDQCVADRALMLWENF